MDPVHQKQGEAFDDPSRFKYLLCGRRGGKTIFLREAIAKGIINCPPGGEIFYIGPTNIQAREIIWEELEFRFEELKLEFRTMISKSRFEFSDRRKVYVIGAEKIRRIRGHKVFGVYLDEIAFYDTDLGKVWEAVRPSLSDLKGHAVVATTPDGKGTQAYDFYLETLKKEDWKYFHWLTVDNPYIDPEEIEAAKRELDERSFNQEYMASWESYEGLAYYNFNESKHLKECKEFDYRYPVCMTFDFNVNPTTIILAQDIRRHHFFRKEYSKRNSSTPETVREFCQDFKEKKQDIRLEVYGDSTGRNRHSSTGFSDYHYVEEELKHEGFNYTMKLMAKNPPVVDRVNHMNGHLKNVIGESRITVDPSCTDLIRDLSSQSLESNRKLSDKNNLGHKADSAGYYIYYKHRMQKVSPQRTIQL